MSVVSELMSEAVSALLQSEDSGEMKDRLPVMLAFYATVRHLTVEARSRRRAKLSPRPLLPFVRRAASDVS